jgi:thiamine biosynthesis lipoprotein
MKAGATPQRPRWVAWILIIASLALLLAIAARALRSGRGAGSAAADAHARPVTYAARTMGTYVRLTLVTADSAASAPLAQHVLQAFTRVDSLMSNWTTTSEVARLNREAARARTPVEPEVARVIASSLDVWRGSAGAFDITVEPLMRVWGFLGGHPHVPSAEEAAAAFRRVGARQVHFDSTARTLRFDNDGVRIDLGGIAKGYAVQVAAESLVAHGIHDALVDLSGNMFALGAPPGVDHWRIGIRDPRDRIPYFARVPLTEQGISTSGKYEQFVAANGKTYGHIMDPRTGRPAEGLISVTVISSSAFTCDAWDTPLFVLGVDEAKHIAKRRDDIDVILVEPGAVDVDTVWVERTLVDRFELEPSARRWFVVRIF